MLGHLPSIVRLVVLASASAASFAADPGRGSAAPATPFPGRQLQAVPLQGALRLSPATASAGMARLSVPKTSIDALTQKFNELSGKAKSYESMAKAAPAIAQECAAKSYSIQDQQAAGCLPSDTVAQCSDKLLKHCVESYSKKTTLPSFGPSPGQGTSKGGVPYFPGTGSGGASIGFSTKEFQQTAAAAAADARALSQALNLYASQVEQNAKAFAP